MKIQNKINTVAIVIMAAGKGTRMKSDKAKVLHEIGNRPMISYVVETAKKVAGDDVVVVIGHQAETVKKVVSKEAQVLFAVQKEQRGTGDAVKSAMPVIPSHADDVIILSGDVPFIKPETVKYLHDFHLKQNNDITILAIYLDEPFGYGRIITNATNNVEQIVEETDATPAQRQIKTVNSGIYCVRKQCLSNTLRLIQANNRQFEIYLTDIVEIAASQGKKIGMVMCPDPSEVKGVNTSLDLSAMEDSLYGIPQRLQKIA